MEESAPRRDVEHCALLAQGHSQVPRDRRAEARSHRTGSEQRGPADRANRGGRSATGIVEGVGNFDGPSGRKAFGDSCALCARCSPAATAGRPPSGQRCVAASAAAGGQAGANPTMARPYQIRATRECLARVPAQSAEVSPARYSGSARRVAARRGDGSVMRKYAAMSRDRRRAMPQPARAVRPVRRHQTKAVAPPASAGARSRRAGGYRDRRGSGPTPRCPGRNPAHPAL